GEAAGHLARSDVAPEGIDASGLPLGLAHYARCIRARLVVHLEVAEKLPGARVEPDAPAARREETSALAAHDEGLEPGLRRDLLEVHLAPRPRVPVHRELADDPVTPLDRHVHRDRLVRAGNGQAPRRNLGVAPG